MGEEKVATFNDLEKWLSLRRVTEVECLVPDLTGEARGKILQREKFTEERGMRLRPSPLRFASFAGSLQAGRDV